MDDKPKPEAGTWTRERCFIHELLNSPDIPDVSVARARVEPGVTTELHALSVTEWYVIEAGQGLVRVGADSPRRVVPGDTVHIPAGRKQQITNTGGADLLFFCVCVPRFSTAAYTSFE